MSHPNAKNTSALMRRNGTWKSTHTHIEREGEREGGREKKKKTMVNRKEER